MTDKNKRNLKIFLKITSPIWVLPWAVVKMFVWDLFLQPLFEEIDDAVDKI